MTANASFVFVLGVAGLAFSIALSIVGFRCVNRRGGPAVCMIAGALFLRCIVILRDLIP